MIYLIPPDEEDEGVPAPRRGTHILPTAPLLRRSERIREQSRPTERVNCALEDPKSLSEALASPKSREWKKAMQREMDSLASNKVWTLTDLPRGKKAVGSRWVYKTKLGADGRVSRNKARLVARGFAQRPGTDYDETFSPVARCESVRFVFALAAQEEMFLDQMDVETGFLNGILEEEVYMHDSAGGVRGERTRSPRM